MAWKIFVGVLGALLAFWLISSALVVLGFIGVAHVAGEAVRQELGDRSQHAYMRIPDPEAVRLEVQARPVVDQRYAADAAERRRQSVQLSADERCIGGAVVRVEGSTYTQVGSVGQPVHCVDRLADRPLRN